MAFQGEYFVARYGRQQAERTPPIGRMLALGVPVGAGTDATRVSSYNPFLSLYWLVTGNTVGGLNLYPEQNRLDRMEALRLYTVGSAWFSTEEGKKGSIAPGQLADLAVLSADYFSVSDEDIKRLESVLATIQMDDAVNIQFTSGTTGLPKGATLSHHNLINNAFFVGEATGIKPGSRGCDGQT